jgi:hypothetical protein
MRPHTTTFVSRLSLAPFVLNTTKYVSSYYYVSLASVWSQHVDDNTREVYYHNSLTQQSVWVKPPELCWSEHVDPQSGKSYFYNSETKQTLWTKPSDEAAGATKPPFHSTFSVLCRHCAAPSGCPHSATFVSAYSSMLTSRLSLPLHMCPHTTICILILQCVLSRGSTRGPPHAAAAAASAHAAADVASVPFPTHAADVGAGAFRHLVCVCVCVCMYIYILFLHRIVSLFC